ncbi:MAG: aryl-sulfate sulfotransferase [Williamsia sp.]|nr:aryl-sulfate sulfotransferase [Williamsia sp.]
MGNRRILTWIFLLFIAGACKKDKGPEVLVNSDPTDGITLYSPLTGGTTDYGSVLLLDKYGNTIAQQPTSADAYNFEKWTANGKVRYTYLQRDLNTKQTDPSMIPCNAFILDENFVKLKKISLLPYNGRTDALAVDGHEFIYIDDNHYITLSYFEKGVTNIPASLNPVANCKVVTPIIQEVMNDKVVWEWQGADYPEFYANSIESNKFSDATVFHDYMHMNSMFLDPTDNNLICSNRNQNNVIKINRTSGAIMWRLGGNNSNFTLTSNMKFLRQHHATLTDNNQTLLIFDNGQITERKWSRIVEFKLNTNENTVQSFSSFNLPDSTFCQFMGSVQKRGDTYFIGCGSTPKLMEVNYKTGKINLLMSFPKYSYRALKY